MREGLRNYFVSSPGVGEKVPHCLKLCILICEPI